MSAEMLYRPHSWLASNVNNSEGGLDGLAERSDIPLTRLREIMRGESATQGEVHAIAQALDTPPALLFVPPKPDRRGLRRVAIGGSITVLVMMLAALAGLIWVSHHPQMLPPAWRAALEAPIAVHSPPVPTGRLRTELHPTAHSSHAGPKAPVLPKN